MPTENDLTLATEKEQQALVNSSLLRVDEFVRREYLSVLDEAVPLDSGAKKIEAGTNVQLMYLQSFVYDSEDHIAQKIQSVYGTILLSGITAALILDARENEAHLYMGVFTKDPVDTNSNYKAFLNSFNGVFPGCRYRNVKSDDCKRLLGELLDPPMKVSVAAVSAFSSSSEDKQDNLSPEGLEVLLDGMHGHPFTMVFLAQALENRDLVLMRRGYESLYTQIAPLQKYDVSLSTSGSVTVGSSISSSITQSLNVSTGYNVSHTDTVGDSASKQTTPNTQDTAKKQALGLLLGTGASLLLANPVAGQEAANVLQSLFFGSSIGNIINNARTVADAKQSNAQEVVTDTHHEDHAVTTGKQTNISSAVTDAATVGASDSRTQTDGKTIQQSYINRAVVDLLSSLEARIGETMRLEAEGAFRTAAYFIAGDAETVSSAANLYRSVATSARATTHGSCVYCWDQERHVRSVLGSIIRGDHPLFLFPEHPDFPSVMAAQPIGLADLPAYLRMPRKSFFGLSVTQHASFSRNILFRNAARLERRSTVDIGCIYHMGKSISNAAVELDIHSLTSHLFVAGATGVGKSNFCYQLLDRLTEKGVGALIIEPTKGEYAQVFGGRDDFCVYGTNPRYSPPLRINPFAFPKGINASEHIERLMTIFSAAWPLYSAMPAILKEALDEIYLRMGFDDVWGELPEGGSFPTFGDLLEVLPEIIKSSEYSKEVQGNYIGALVTRVKSLTSGILSAVFTDDDVGDSALFDQNVIVDISRVGSEETKSLIMGFLVMRLTEYRSCSGLMNSPLKHITLLEEAHHLLGRQRGAVQDMGNMHGASVEMLNNAIREMRTYGEGFVIADQSPAVMEQSVISNTQTKVYFMMPHKEDRDIARDSASLNERQALEISKLPCGVAMVLQNEWEDAVLCKIHHFSPAKYKRYEFTQNAQGEARRILTQALTCVLAKNVGGDGMDAPPFSNGELSACYGLGARRGVIAQLAKRLQGDPQAYLSLEEQGAYIEKLLDARTLLRGCRPQKSIDAWAKALERAILAKASLTPEAVCAAVGILLRYYAMRDEQYQELYVKYLIYRNERGD